VPVMSLAGTIGKRPESWKSGTGWGQRRPPSRTGSHSPIVDHFEIRIVGRFTKAQTELFSHCKEHEILLRMRNLEQLRKRKSWSYEIAFWHLTHLRTSRRPISRLLCISNPFRCRSVVFVCVSVNMESVTNIEKNCLVHFGNKYKKCRRKDAVKCCRTRPLGLQVQLKR